MPTSGAPTTGPAYKSGDRLKVKIGDQDVDGTVETVDTATNKVTVKPMQGGTSFMIDMPAAGQPVVTKAAMDEYGPGEEGIRRSEQELYPALDRAPEPEFFDESSVEYMHYPHRYMSPDDYEVYQHYGKFRVQLDIDLEQSDIDMMLEYPTEFLGDLVGSDKRVGLTKDMHEQEGLEKPLLWLGADKKSVEGYWYSDEMTRNP